MKNKIEILAPAGSMESVYAAVRNHADAVYLGTSNFSARKNATNFDPQELKAAVDYAHARNVKVHVALNTLINDDEIELALETVKHVCTTGADVLILQDLGLASLVQSCASQLRRHASTQMSVQTVAGVKLLENLGYDRVVLPREMTKAEIKKITSNTTIETEIFVHGALCMCVSGQCLLSSMFGSRSGNRGLCAQPCRLPFAVPNGTGFDLSLKDLSIIDKLDEVQALGVNSVKIEGRMKRPEYVASATAAVHNKIIGEEKQEVLDNLRAVFSRSGFTDGYFEAKRGRDMFGTRQKQDVVSAEQSLLNKIAVSYDKETGLIPIDFMLSVVKDEKISLSATALGKTCFIENEYIPEIAINKPMSEENLKARISKCGGTQFFAQNVEVELDDGLVVPASVINALRREAIENIESQILSVKPKDFTDINLNRIKHTTNGKPKFHVRVRNGLQTPKNLANVENLYFPLEIEENYVENVENSHVLVGVEIPRGIFGNEEYVKKHLMRVKKLGINTALCLTLDGVAIAQEMGFDVHTGFSMNVFNSYSVEVLEDLGVKSLTLSPELTLEQAADISSVVPRGIVAYGRLPLMLTRNCPIKNGTTCGECRGRGVITDRKNVKFPVTCTMGCSEILNSRPIYMADRMHEVENMDFISFYFTGEKPASIEKILEYYEQGKAINGEYTRGLYYRGVE